jgi:hypothetical protein
MQSHFRWRATLLVVPCVLLFAAPLRAEPPQGAFGFNGAVSGFPTGKVVLTGGGAYDLATDFVHSGGGFSCIEDVVQGPLSVSINLDDPGACLAGEGVRWDTAALLRSTTFKCTGAATELLKTATTNNTTVVLQADLYRAGDGIDESFTANMIVSATDIAPDITGLQNLWVQGVGCGTAIVAFSNKQAQTNFALATASGAPKALQGSTNGAAGQMPAFYEGELFTVNMKELSDTGSGSIIARNGSLNEIYASNDLDEEQDFIPVINAIPTEGFNPLWHQILIVFNEGFTPHQFFSEEEIEEAAAGTNPEITLVETDEVYRCSVVGGS